MIIDTYTVEEIKAIRLLTGIPATTIAESIGVTKQTYYNVEKGATKLTGPMAISLTVAMNALCEEMNVDPNKVLDDYEIIKKASRRYVDKVIEKLDKLIKQTD